MLIKMYNNLYLIIFYLCNVTLDLILKLYCSVQTNLRKIKCTVNYFKKMLWGIHILTRQARSRRQRRLGTRVSTALSQIAKCQQYAGHIPRNVPMWSAGVFLLDQTDASSYESHVKYDTHMQRIFAILCMHFSAFVLIAYVIVKCVRYC